MESMKRFINPSIWSDTHIALSLSPPSIFQKLFLLLFVLYFLKSVLSLSDRLEMPEIFSPKCQECQEFVTLTILKPYCRIRRASP